MPVNHAVWKVGEKPELLSHTKLLSEQQLEDMIVKSPEILSKEWMLIGRQEHTGLRGAAGTGRIDLLAITPDGSLVLIELKRDKSARDIVAQALDYATWVSQLTADKIAQIYHRFSNGGSLDEAFQNRFGFQLDEETLNESHQIILVASALDASTERIINYLNVRDIAINVIFFQVFQHGDEKLLSRVWLIDPTETQANAAVTNSKTGDKEPWNGEYYVSFGDDRNWEDARKYGYVSGGGGSWYSQTLKMLSPGDRVWVKIPKTGYVGVGIVTEEIQAAKDFKVITPEGEKPCLEIIEDSEYYKTYADDPEKSEYFVKVKWLDTVPASMGLDEVGLFGNQNTVCQPKAPKWRYTVERLKSFFKNWDNS
jgi:hypothetical protein